MDLPIDEPETAPAPVASTTVEGADLVAALFRAALEGDRASERDLRELALGDDRAADASCAVALADALEEQRHHPAQVAHRAATDQVLGALRAEGLL